MKVLSMCSSFVVYLLTLLMEASSCSGFFYVDKINNLLFYEFCVKWGSLMKAH